MIYTWRLIRHRMTIFTQIQNLVKFQWWMVIVQVIFIHLKPVTSSLCRESQKGDVKTNSRFIIYMFCSHGGNLC